MRICSRQCIGPFWLRLTRLRCCLPRAAAQVRLPAGGRSAQELLQGFIQFLAPEPAHYSLLLLRRCAFRPAAATRAASAAQTRCR